MAVKTLEKEVVEEVRFEDKVQEVVGDAPFFYEESTTGSWVRMDGPENARHTIYTNNPRIFQDLRSELKVPADMAKSYQTPIFSYKGFKVKARFSGANKRLPGETYYKIVDSNGSEDNGLNAIQTSIYLIEE